MCQKKPGPRCSYHAKKRLQRASAAYKEAESTELTESTRSHLRRSLQQARSEYDSTPAGLADLETRIAGAGAAIGALTEKKAAGEEIDVRALNEAWEQLMSLEERRDLGKRIRKHQSEAFKDSTPEGIAALKEELAAAETDYKDTLSDRESDPKNYYSRVYGAERRLKTLRKRIAPYVPLEGGEVLAEHWTKEEGSGFQEEFSLPSGDKVAVWNNYSSAFPRSQGYRKIAWLTRDDKPIGMIRFYANDEGSPYDHTVMCDIEIRPEYRGHKLGQTLMGAISARYGQLHSSGAFSLSGYRSLYGVNPLAPHSDLQVEPRTDHYTFVDWTRGDLVHE